MAFTLTCKSLELQGPVLTAECRAPDGDWRTSYLDLNGCLGNLNGLFWLDTNEFFHTAKSVRLEGHTLRAYLRRVDGEYNDCSLDLTLCLENIDGDMQFHKP